MSLGVFPRLSASVPLKNKNTGGVVGRRARVRPPRRAARALPSPSRAHPEGHRAREGARNRRRRRAPRGERRGSPRDGHAGCGRSPGRRHAGCRFGRGIARRRAPKPRPRDGRAHHRARAGDDRRAGRRRTTRVLTF